ncbi:MAG: hypothetical protein CL693_00125 [Cellvibrionaceae bacterium]|nr:hypothetical protein [Cellvibrionaceae bacterium]|tara:strand:- start:568 stop:1440 length:873 start_codon:yes stop_codon:yes gene_type:complete
MLTEKEKKGLQQKIQSNAHEVYVVSFEEMDAIIQSSPKGQKSSVQEAWQKIKGNMGVGASYYASADDAVTMAKLMGDLGGVGARAYIKSYGGKPHIVLKGHAGMRAILTGTKYGIKNPKVISMGLGRSGAVAAAKQGGILTVVLLSTYRVADYFLTDRATLSQLIGTLATDVVKVGMATGAAILIASSTVVATFAVGPIVAVVLVGLGASMLLEYTDNRLGITNRVIEGLDELGNDVVNYIAHKRRRALSAAGEVVDGVIDFAVESAREIAVIWVRKTLREYLSPIQGAR